MTDAQTWIKRLERRDRLPGLRIPDVIACLGLKRGDVVADIGAGTGAYALPFARAVAPDGRVYAVDIWKGLTDYIREKARNEEVSNLQTILATIDDPRLPPHTVDLAFFHNVFHNTNDRQAYLRVLDGYLNVGGRIAIIEPEFDDPIAKRWDEPEDRLTKEQVDGWMTDIGFARVGDYDIFQGANNPDGAGMPQRWFVVYGPSQPT